MDPLPYGCHAAGHLNGRVGLLAKPRRERLGWLYTQILGRISSLRATIPCSSMASASMSELRYHREITKERVLTMINDLEEAMEAYADEEPDQQEVD